MKRALNKCFSLFLMLCLLLSTLQFTAWAAKAPTPTTGSAYSITATSATITGIASCNTTDVSFEYGTTPSCGTSISAVDGIVVGPEKEVYAYISGLTGNTTYYYRVSAAGGTTIGALCTFTTSAIAPGAPAIGPATAGNAQASVRFTAPSSTGGEPITAYTVTSNPGGITATGNSSPITVTGLANGTAYTFTVTAKNNVGTGSASAPSNSVTPSDFPGAPTIGTATAGDTKASVSFTAPSYDGGTTITSYTVTSSPGGITSTAASSPITFTGLTNGTAYTFTVTASNSAGTGSASASSNSVTPLGIPDAPVIVSAAAGDGQATVNWTAPSNNGGSAITGYTVYYEETANVANNGSVTVGEAETSKIVTGLTNGTEYNFMVTAENSVGISPHSNTVSAVPKSSDATLSGLKISEGTLSPTFTSGTTEYAVTVPNSVKSVIVTPTANDTKATITVNGTLVTSAAASGVISLVIGDNKISVVVTAQNGTVKTYTITVSRAGHLSPAIVPKQASFTVEAKAGLGGKISSSGTNNVLYGDSISFTITADKDYKISDVQVDNVNVGAVSSYTLKNVDQDHVIKANFEKISNEKFLDVNTNDWFYDSVTYIQKKGLMKGTGSNYFTPNGSMTRAMFVTALYRMSGDTNRYTNRYIDVSSNEWYENAVAWAASKGVAGGVGEDRFSPNNNMTREQLAVMLYNYAKYKGMDVSAAKDTNILSYTDASTISEYAYSAMQWACAVGVINGENNCLNPQKFASRAEVAAMLKRFMNL